MWDSPVESGRRGEGRRRLGDVDRLGALVSGGGLMPKTAATLALSKGTGEGSGAGLRRGAERPTGEVGGRRGAETEVVRPPRPRAPPVVERDLMVRGEGESRGEGMGESAMLLGEEATWRPLLDTSNMVE